MSLNGVVTGKYIDSSEHSYKTVIIRNLKDSITNKLILDFDTTDVFNKYKSTRYDL